MLIYRRKVFNKSAIRKIIDRSIFLVLFTIIAYLSYYYYKKIEKQEYTSASNANMRILGYVSNADGEKTPLYKQAIHGRLESVSTQDNKIEFRGWVFDGRNSRVPDDILVSYNKEAIYWSRTNFRRQDLVNVFGEDASESGFKFVLPKSIFKEKNLIVSDLRFFAFSNGIASELTYFPGFKNPSEILSLNNDQKKNDNYIINKDGIKVPIIPEAVTVRLDNAKIKGDSQIEFSGWAYDSRDSRIPDNILLTYKGENIHWGECNIQRRDLVNAYGQNAQYAGFKLNVILDKTKVKDLDRDELHLYAISNGVASELNNYKGFK